MVTEKGAGQSQTVRSEASAAHLAVPNVCAPNFNMRCVWMTHIKFIHIEK